VSLRTAVVGRDRGGYERGHDRLETLLMVRQRLAERDAVTTRVRAAMPKLTAAVLSHPDDPVWDGRIAVESDLCRRVPEHPLQCEAAELISALAQTLAVSVASECIA
jgi:hypothetical protein